jgi:hypothetical protein
LPRGASSERMIARASVRTSSDALFRMPITQ